MRIVKDTLDITDGRDSNAVYASVSAKTLVKGSGRLNLILTHLRKTEKLGGACAEVGVYKGGTASLIAKEKGNRPFHCFDTFEGIPHVSKEDTFYEVGMHPSNYENVSNILKKYPDTHVYKGVFPEENSEVVAGLKFSFVHLDVDVYKSYVECLPFFYSRMLKGGVIVHDDYAYKTCSGATQAIDEFYADKPEIEDVRSSDFVDPLSSKKTEKLSLVVTIR